MNAFLSMHDFAMVTVSLHSNRNPKTLFFERSRVLFPAPTPTLSNTQLSVTATHLHTNAIHSHRYKHIHINKNNALFLKKKKFLPNETLSIKTLFITA